MTDAEIVDGFASLRNHLLFLARDKATQFDARVDNASRAMGRCTDATTKDQWRKVWEGLVDERAEFDAVHQELRKLVDAAAAR